MCTPQGILEKLACLAFDETVKDVVKRRKYVLNYSANLEELRSEMTRLEDHWTIIERKVSVANDRGEEVENLVLHWQTKVEDLRKEFQELTQKSIDHEKMRCFACSCPNIKWRYRLSKQAEEKIVHVRKLIEDSCFDEISHARPLPPELQCRSNENYENFASRTPIFKAIVEALKDASVNVIGIHGLGGVGKTTLVEEVGKKMQQDETFKQFTLAAISKDINVKEIQLKLAYSLNFRFDANVDDQKGRAAQLWHKFNNGEKYLVILDDLWEEVDIKAIGIPITDGKTGCKVVLTSRKEGLLVRMKVDRHFLITELHKPEAWTLFKMKVGDSIESQLELRPLALKVCEKCKGLPVAINAIGAALQGKQDHAWRNVLFQLERYMLPNIEDIDQSVWASLRVSYDMLRSSDAKSCFLLCCLFAEDAEIPLEDLTRYCVARGLLFQNPRTLEEARDAICSIVDSLKSASLLSIGSNENVVRIHDVIRDVGISIARDEKAMLVDSGALQWPQNPVNGPSYSVISLSSATIERLPDDLEYPQLHTLMFDNGGLTDLEVPDNFFVGMKQLTVLILARMQMWWLPSSLAKLPNLRMLCLNQCKLAEMSILGDLKTKLDVLSFQGSTIKGLPQEIAQLTSLRLLDLRDCDDLELIPQGIICKLTNLEELYFAETFDKWEATMSKSKNMSLDELRSLLSTGRLTTLHIHIPAVTLLPKEDLMFEKLKKFRISMGSKFKWDEDFPGTRVLKYEGSSLRKEFIPLVDKAEALYLSGINDMNRFHPLQSFNKLSVLWIGNCKLKYLFSPTTARGLVHLEELQVKDCEIIEEIVGFEGQKDGNELIFSKLKILHLEGLPNLTSFYAEKEKTRTTKGSSSTRHQSLFNEKVIFPVLEELEVEELDSIEEIWDKQSPSVNEKTTSFSQLTDVTVKKCEKLMNLGPWNILSRLRNLQRLTVYGCPNVEFIVLFKNGKGEEEVADDSTLIIPLLRHLRIGKMEKLKSFYSSSTTANAQSLFNHQVIFPVLETLQIEEVGNVIEIWDKQSIGLFEAQGSFCQLMNVDVWRCNKLTHLFPSKLQLLKNLQELEVGGCETMEGVVGFEGDVDEDGLRNEQVCFSKLTYLLLRNLPKLVSFCTKMEEAGTTEGNPTIHAQPLFNGKVIFPVLEELKILEVDKIIEIWDKQSLTVFEAHGSFCQLLNMEVSGCNKLTHLFPSKMHGLLKNLKELEVEDCETMEGVVGFEGDVDEDGLRNEQVCFSKLGDLSLKKLPKLVSFSTKMGEAGTSEGNPTIHAQPLFNGKVILPVLEELEVEELDSIEEIWDKQSPSVNEKTASFSQLTDVTVKKCEKLMNLGPWNILSRLRNLQRLTVYSCPNVEFIVLFKNGKGEEEVADDSTLIIPLLRHLNIEKMEKLKSFYSSSTTANAQSLFNHQVILPVLEELKVEALDSIEEIWDKQSPSVNQETVTFGQLRNISVKRCKKLMNLVPSNILPRLRNLQDLTVEGCPNVEFVVFKNWKEEEEAADDVTFIIPQLRHLHIEKMEKLKSFYSSSTTSNAESLFNHQVILPVLEELKVESLDSIEEIWDKQSPSVNQETASFGQLRNIKVTGCTKLMNLVPSNILPRLRNLQFLKVDDCPNVEFVVFKNKKGEEEAVDDSNLIIPQLRDLQIWNMEKLKSFYSSSTTSNAQSLFNHQIAFPALEDLSIWDTPSITEIWDKKPLSEPEQEIESFGKLATIDISDCPQLVYLLPSYMIPHLQNLQELEIEDCEEVEVIVSMEFKEKEATDPVLFSRLKDVKFSNLPKLKGFIFSNKVAFPALEHLTITKMPKIKEIWDKQPLPEPEKKPKSFYKLTSVHVEGCNQLVYVFPSYMLPQLQNLEKLAIANCKEMEVIISNKLKEKFAKLKTMILQNLPNLKRLCAETQLGFSNKDAFPVLEINIEELTIEHPLDLRYLKTSCIAPNLMFLVNGTSTKAVAIEESGTSGKDEDSNDHDKEGEDGEEDVKNADDNKGVGGEEKDEDDQRKEDEEETEDHISNLD